MSQEPQAKSLEKRQGTLTKGTGFDYRDDIHNRLVEEANRTIAAKVLEYLVERAYNTVDLEVYEDMTKYVEFYVPTVAMEESSDGSLVYFSQLSVHAKPDNSAMAHFMNAQSKLSRNLKSNKEYKGDWLSEEDSAVILENLRKQVYPQWKIFMQYSLEKIIPNTEIHTAQEKSHLQQEINTRKEKAWKKLLEQINADKFKDQEPFRRERGIEQVRKQIIDKILLYLPGLLQEGGDGKIVVSDADVQRLKEAKDNLTPHIYPVADSAGNVYAWRLGLEASQEYLQKICNRIRFSSELIDIFMKDLRQQIPEAVGFFKLFEVERAIETVKAVKIRPKTSKEERKSHKQIALTLKMLESMARDYRTDIKKDFDQTV